MTTIRYHLGDVRDVMSGMADDSVDLFVTSPPFLALRSYLPQDHPDKHREIGSEPTPAEFLDTLLELTAEWRRLLTPTGSLCVELGDTYSGSSNDGGPQGPGISGDGGARWRDRLTADLNDQLRRGPGWPLAKSLCGIPTLYTWSLAYGRNLLTGRPSPAGQWRIRNLIVWHRPNPPVGALGDKVRPSTSYVTTACTSDRRWFDLDSERTAFCRDGREQEGMRRRGHPTDAVKGPNLDRGDLGAGNFLSPHAGAPPLDAWIHDDTPADVWTIPTQAYAGAHYATFPVALPRRLINLMCPRQVCTVCGEARRRIVADATYVQSRNAPTLGWSSCGHDDYRPGMVLDPFAGTATTALAATLLGRDATCIDIDPRNIGLARHRIGDHVAILNETSDGPVTTWTVEAGLPGVKGEAEGQLNLFSETATAKETA